ncbi:hypothetical protein AB7M31_002952 [Pseudomonas sp. IAP-CY TE4608]
MSASVLFSQQPISLLSLVPYPTNERGAQSGCSSGTNHSPGKCLGHRFFRASIVNLLQQWYAPRGVDTDEQLRNALGGEPDLNVNAYAVSIGLSMTSRM